jgi:hypothetical protein
VHYCICCVTYAYVHTARDSISIRSPLLPETHLDPAYVFLTCTRTGDETAPPRGVEPAGHRVVVDGGDVRSAEINRRVSSIAGPEREKSRDAGRPPA